MEICISEYNEKKIVVLLDNEMKIVNPVYDYLMLEIRYKYGKNSILRGISYTPASTARERNNQIGGHKSGNEDSKGSHAKVKTG